MKTPNDDQLNADLKRSASRLGRSALVVAVPGTVPPAIPRTGYGISEPLKLVGLLLTTGLGFLIVSKRRKPFYLVLPPLR